MIVYKSRKTKTAELKTASSFEPKQWVLVSDPSSQELAHIAAEVSAEQSLLQDALDADEMPRLEIEDDKVYLFARYAIKTSGGNIHTYPLLTVIHDELFLTLTSSVYTDLEQLLQKQPHLTTANPKRLLLPVLNLCLQSYASQLAYIGRQIRTSRNSLRDEKFSNKHFVRFVEIEDILNDFLSELVPINNILLNLLAGRKALQYGEDDRDILEDLQLETAQLIDESKGYLKTIVNIREAYSNIMTNNLNRQIKILTTLTIVLTVPTIVGSFFGMNVLVPLDNAPYGFVIIIGLTFTFSAIVLYILKRKDWL